MVMFAFINGFIEGVGPWILYVSGALWGIWVAQIRGDMKERDRIARESWGKDLQRYYASKANSG